MILKLKRISRVKCLAGSEMCSYEEAEKCSSMGSSLIYALGKVVAVFTGLPAFQTLYCVLVQEKALSESFVLPIFCIFPFEINCWSRYAFAFALTYCAYIILCMHKVIPTSILLTTCFYTIAVIRDVCCKMTELNIVE